MINPIYQALAERLDTIPNGYPRTESGVEIKILEKLFTPDEATLACLVKLLPEPPAAIAERACEDEAVIRRRLKAMVRRGLLGAMRFDDGLRYHLLPFVVGIYELNLGRMDAELAQLVEAYFQETKGEALFRTGPSVHRVIPVEQTISTNLDVAPFEQASHLIRQAKAWGVRNCICRVQQKLIGKGCDHPVEVCLSFSPVAGWFDDDPDTRPLTLDEALDLLRETEEAGLVHTIGNYRDNHFYICNCCTCSCGILRGVAEFNIPTAIANSDYWAQVDEVTCNGCEDCLDRCQFGAITIPDMLAVVDTSRCVGCGQCATACSIDAIRMERRPDSARDPLPNDLVGWMMARAQARGLDMSGIL